MARKDNYWAGFAAYRYGSAGKAAKPRQVIKGDRRTHVVDQVVALLKAFTSSPFQHEGALRAGIRSALCMAGHRWALADLEAEAIVAEGLRRIGAVRPSWAEGQWTHTDSPDFCSWCRKPMDDVERTRGQRFCSPHCARCALERRDYETHAGKEAISRSAYRLISKMKRPPITCVHCGKQFHSDATRARFCSNTCAMTHRWVDNTLPDKTCEHCGTLFHPLRLKQRACSLSCGRFILHADKRAALASETRTCLTCEETFTPTAKESTCCSDRCRLRKNYLARKRAARLAPPSLTAEIFDGWFAMAT